MKSLTVGSEVATYRRVNGPTGVPRVIRETHRHLVPLLQEHGVSMAPVHTGTSQAVECTTTEAYISSDSLLSKSTLSPSEVDLLLLLDPSPTIDYSSLVRIKRKQHLPVIAMINDLLPLRHPEWFLPDAPMHYRILCQQILHVADHVIVPSRHVFDEFSKFGWENKSQLHVFHLGTSFSQLPPRDLIDTRVKLLYVATVAPRKGHKRLLEAYDLLRSRGLQVHLTIVGRVGWEADELVALLRSHPEFGVSLQWVEDANDEQVRELLATTNVAVIPSEAEGFGLFLEEALSAGISVVASDIPVFRERPNANLFFAGDSAAELAQVINIAADHKPLALCEGQVRSMRDFSDDLSKLILQELGAVASW